MAGIIELWGRLAIPYPLPLKSLVEEVKMGRTGPPYKRTEKRPNSCSRREKLGRKLAKNSQKLFKKIALEKRKTPSIYQRKMQIRPILYGEIWGDYAAGIIEIWEGVAILPPRLEALTGFIGIMRGLGRQIAAILWQADLNPGFFPMPIPIPGGLMVGTDTPNR